MWRSLTKAHKDFAFLQITYHFITETNISKEKCCLFISCTLALNLTKLIVLLPSSARPLAFTTDKARASSIHQWKAILISIKSQSSLPENCTEPKLDFFWSKRGSCKSGCMYATILEAQTKTVIAFFYYYYYFKVLKGTQLGLCFYIQCKIKINE